LGHRVWVHSRVCSEAQSCRSSLVHSPCCRVGSCSRSWQRCCSCQGLRSHHQLAGSLAAASCCYLQHGDHGQKVFRQRVISRYNASNDDASANSIENPCRIGCQADARCCSSIQQSSSWSHVHSLAALPTHHNEWGTPLLLHDLQNPLFRGLKHSVGAVSIFVVVCLL
jgi:hypothetical protein